MGRQKRVVWVLMHYEILGLPDGIHVDSVESHVSSSLAKAEEYIRDMWVEAHSWWQLHPYEIDATPLEEINKVFYYSHRSTRLTAAPTKTVTRRVTETRGASPRALPDTTAEKKVMGPFAARVRPCHVLTV